MPSMVVIPSNGQPTRRIRIDRVDSIVCHRVKNQEEQYLVRWETTSRSQNPPLSWHNLKELSRCLELVQDYIDALDKLFEKNYISSHLLKKRKSPDTADEHERRPSPIDRHFHQPSRTPSTERSPSVSSSSLSVTTHNRLAATASSPEAVDIYNGVLDTEDGFIFARCASSPGIPQIDVSKVPTIDMLAAARGVMPKNAELMIRAQYLRQLARVPGKKIHLINTHDASSPSLRFRYINDYVLREGVYKADPATQMGCQQCSPRMGRDIGCEYTKKCDCLEYAAVNENSLDENQKMLYEKIRAEGGSTIGLPKKFPYFTEGSKMQRAGCLVPFYLNSRRPIYECNDNCRCGPNCRNKNVQFGRTVELEIFKTGTHRGWGLRCRENLAEGQFIDTYRGEIITDMEATRREESSNDKSKASYLYSLDKFAESENLAQEDIYVVDGEFMGGPTKFMNHSCEPNCRQYTVSYNKHDCRVYDIAFFACREIRAGEELTFDYLDKEEEDEIEEPEDKAEAVPCLCGAEKCRKWLWT
ncbi:SET domain-containing protein [Zopfia rhizophila CBS 207.26]|uniref:SET domain-containing protein n=1 Tax=Zopfia rhizophila CBS 207.26 TaxID=1314779 RepID=A0A6A6ECQ3_9PEZI|nr:SET domain-containing protein [Zopfia rhizophila CBS 207.26]